MVVPSNRRGFLATLALAAGISTPAMASPIIQSVENPEGLPVILFNKGHQLILPKGIVFDPMMKIGHDERIDPKCSCLIGASFVWVPIATPVTYCEDWNESKIIYGKMILGKWRWLAHGNTEWFLLVPCDESVVCLTQNRFRTMDSIRMEGKEF